MEEYKYIKGYEGVYQINRSGLVRRINKDERSQRYRNIKPSIRNGYYCYSLAGKKYSLHRLLMINYVPNPNELPCVNHIDGDRLNNNLTNLEWCSYKENTIHAYKIGNMKSHTRKINDEDVNLIKKMRSDGVSPYDISKAYNVSYPTIYRICSGKSYKTISDR